MLNAEKFKEEIERLNYDFAVVNEKVVLCLGTACKSCRFHNDCRAKMTEWLLSEYEEIKIEPEVYDIACDDKVEVSHDRVNWYKRHFKCIEGERVSAWNGGTTSFSASDENDATRWEYARVPREEIRHESMDCNRR